LELYQLRSFVAVSELGHLTRAADKLHISQPALSAQIKALEDELGVELFDRKPNGMMLTAAGKQLVSEAQGLLSAAQTLRDHARAMKGTVAGRVRLGTVSDPQFIRVGELLSAAVERFPLLEIQLHHEVSGAAFEKVRDGNLDASFYYGEMTHASVASIGLREITYRIVAPASWKDRIAHAGWNHIAGEAWIMTPPISTHHQLASTLFRSQGIEPTTVVEADDEVVVASLVLSGLGMALMREDIALEKAQSGEICLWQDVRLSTTLQFIYGRERENDPAMHALLELFKEIWSLHDGRRKTLGPERAARRLPLRQG
jgi:DNA-binding transcriptional LysR family regulator